MAHDFGLQTASGHLTVSEESKEPYPADVEAQFRADAAEVIARYPEKRSALLPLLHLVQSVDGYVTGRGIDLCAELLDLSTAEVSGVATFYTQYKRHPNGEYTVGVCTNTLCAIMGGDEIWDTVSEHLGVGHDETTDDGKVTLERIECNAACDYAPVVMTNWEFFDNQTPESTVQLVDDLRSGKDVAPDPRPRPRVHLQAGEPRARRLPRRTGRRGCRRRACLPARSEDRAGAGMDRPRGRVEGARDGIRPRPGRRRGKTPGNTEVTPASDDAKATKAEPAATRDAGEDAPSEDETPTRTTGSSARKKKGS